MSAFLYHDAQLYPRDLALFPSNQWLNDAAIQFYFTWVYHEECGAAPGVLFMDPAVLSCMMLQCDDEEDLQDLAQGLALKEKEVILMPVNDRESFQSQGSHWALLVYTKSSGFEYYDSSSTHNLDSAKEVAQVLQRALGISEKRFRVAECPQQRNSYDCGMYVCMVAQWVSTKWLGIQPLPLGDFVTAETIRSKRKAMPSIVQKLQEQSQ